MDEDTIGEGTASRKNGDLSVYNLDTYDEDDDGPASSASGHAVLRITAICSAQLLVPSPTLKDYSSIGITMTTHISRLRRCVTLLISRFTR